jgi:hypothetical protein
MGVENKCPHSRNLDNILTTMRNYHPHTKDNMNINKTITSKRVQAGEIQAKGVGQDGDDSTVSDVSL